MKVLSTFLLAFTLAACGDVYFEERKPIEEPTLHKEIDKPLIPLTMPKDMQGPQIWGALDGVEQPNYLQEGHIYRQSFINDENGPRFTLEPIGDAMPLDYSQPVKFSRWLTRLNHKESAPRYVIKAMDENDVTVNFAIGYECKEYAAAKHTAEGEGGFYEIAITQDVTDVDLSQESDSSKHQRKICLSIWARDSKGNLSQHIMHFFWNTVLPPLAMDMNSKKYRAHERADDFVAVGQPVYSLFDRGYTPKLKGGRVLGHAILENTGAVSLLASLKLSSSLRLTLNTFQFGIPSNAIDIEYFTYEIAGDKVGTKKEKFNGHVMVGPSETVLAKFILREDFPLENFHSQKNFWNWVAASVSFEKSGRDNPIVNNLSLNISAVAGHSEPTQYNVPWGNDHRERAKAVSKRLRP